MNFSQFLATFEAAQASPPSVCTDSRRVQRGDLFIALRGERMDGHDFLAQAKAGGAAAAVVEQGRGIDGLLCLEVEDTTLALGALAAQWRKRFTLPLVAVTGSNGKTTVTQMLSSIFAAQAGEAAFATQGNFNNEIGVPLTLLRLRPAHQLGVVELGMNHPGEIAALAAMARPTVALVNNAQREHQEFMHSVEAVAAENGAVLEFLPPDGVAVFPQDDAFTPLWQRLAGERRVLTFGQGGAVQERNAHWQQGGAWALEVHTPEGDFSCRLAVAGRHNVRNALAATACALAAGVPLAAIAAGLEAFRPVRGRSQALAVTWQGRSITVVDDSYNANPDSVQAAIAVLAELPAPRLLVLGDMGEVGSQGEAFHQEVGASARAAGIEWLFTLGSASRVTAQAFGAQAWHAETMAQLQQRLLNCLNAQQAASVLIKGSRSMGMEALLTTILETPPSC
ncbi:MAG: UDP-N-acetylmuramoyl-tripeptide--D-alanyl-D-alanine ligase [Comamonas sp.]|nr:UDP-N-acetylmuramoyl-tripeptide--D-alanyl-D-alanine ligase [Comamonas sp.]